MSLVVEDAAAPLCISCGYDLRSLPADGDCPECGTSVQRSLMTGRLEASDPAWLRRMALGLRIVVWGRMVTVVGLLAFMASIPATLLAALMASTTIAGVIIMVTIGGSLLGCAGGLLLVAVGGLVATSANPRESLTVSPPARSRQVSRWSIAICVVLLAVGGVPIAIVPAWGQIVLLLFTIGATIATTRFFHWLAYADRHGAPPTLAERTRKTANGFRTVGVLFGAGIALTAAEVIAGTMMPLPWLRGAAGLVTFIGFILMLTRTIGCGALLREHRDRFRKAAELASAGADAGADAAP